ncbi:MAG: WecB/TagA/CpsF family glycosyltransferase [Oscillospiraceae bacterium]|nr:WecB/TagA/CpsF family glycosyltransferase [Oscillospiraceae bacterium]
MFDIIDVRGAKIANVSLEEAVNAVKEYISGKKHAVFTPNADILQRCIDDKTGKLFELLNWADMLIPDGAGVVSASKILKEPLKQKVGGYELSLRVLDYLGETGKKLFLLGSRQETVELAAKNLGEKYPKIEISFHNGYFNRQNEENEAVLEKINAFSPDVIFVCFGFPAQEQWIHSNFERVNSKLMLGLGGTIDVLAGAKKYAPKIFIKLNLEWLYYLLKSPSRLGRYMTLPRFAMGTLFAKKNKKQEKS